jgi:transcriptional regulator with XRE-family HTH domain
MKDEEPLSFGEYLRMTRLSKRMTLTLAARKMGMKPQKLSDIESGRRYHTRISINLVTLASKAFDVPIAEIIRNTQTAVTNDRTVSELLQEAVPASRMTELLAKQFLDTSKTYSHELEVLAIELHNHARDVSILLATMRRRHFNTSRETSLDASKPDESEEA